VKTYWRREAAAATARATDAWREKRASSLAHGRWMVRELARMKATILAGSDAGTPYVVPGESLHDELAYLVAAGLTPLEALRAATLNPARFVGRGDVGTVTPGAVADLVLLSGNPLEQIGNTRTIVAVYRGGRRVDLRPRTGP
jgi:imidazolonepropionase-like amidohydrolase